MGLALLADRLSAEEAERWGLIWKAVDDARSDGEAGAIAGTLAAGPTKGYGLIKKAIHASAGNSLDAQLDLERDLQREAGFSEDYREGVAAFMPTQAGLQGQVSPLSARPIETAGAEALRALQLERLQWSLKHAYDNVPHYRRKLDAAGVSRPDCRRLEDLARFPFTTKADLRDTYPFGMFAVPMDRIVRIHASSGTAGKPNGRRLHREGRRHVGAPHGALHPRCRRASRRQGACRVRLRAFYGRARRALRRRAPGPRRNSAGRRDDRAAGPAHPGFQA